jgi:NAD(P)H-hydrate epimerase
MRGSGYLDQKRAIPRILQVRCDALVFGPGLGSARTISSIVQELLAQDGPPTIIDADGLNAIAHCEGPLWPAGRPVVLTPHPGEYARLAQRHGLPPAGTTDASRRIAAEALVQETGAFVVLKGHGTVVAGPDALTWTCTCGTNVLAVPGSGDVLSGLIAAMIAQCARAGDADLAAAARLAVEVHARAGLLYAESVSSRGMLAHELADHIAAVLEDSAS